MPDVTGRRYRHGLVVGKFAPLHRGHLRVLDEALARCERVSVWVYSRPDFPDMPSPLRRGWVRSLYPARLFPGLELLPDAPNPPLNGEPDATHRAYVRGVLDDWGVRPDAVFTSEAYGEAFAASLGAAHVCVDRARAAVPVSGSALRAGCGVDSRSRLKSPGKGLLVPATAVADPSLVCVFMPSSRCVAGAVVAAGRLGSRLPPSGSRASRTDLGIILDKIISSESSINSRTTAMVFAATDPGSSSRPTSERSSNKKRPGL